MWVLMETELINVYIIVNTVIRYLMSSRSTVVSYKQHNTSNTIYQNAFRYNTIICSYKEPHKTSSSIFIENKLP